MHTTRAHAHLSLSVCRGFEDVQRLPLGRRTSASYEMYRELRTWDGIRLC